MKNFLLKTKGNFPHNSRESSIRNFVFTLFVACLILVFGKDFLSVVTSMVATPLFEVRHYLETSHATIPVFIRSRIELLDEIRSLQEHIASEQGMSNTLKYVRQENEELRALLHASSSSPRVLAGVIGRPPFTPYDTVILDRGSEAGIVRNAPVFQENGHAIGYVRSVFTQSALVTLFSSPDVESTVYIYGPNIFSTANGEGGGVIHLSIPQGIPIKKGDVVVLPSYDTGVIGSIDEIKSIPSEPEQHAYVTFTTPMQSMRLVTVGTNPIMPTSYSAALEFIEHEEKVNLLFDVPADKLKVHTGSTTSTTTLNSRLKNITTS